jgi:hypothetical protein
MRGKGTGATEGEEVVESRSRSRSGILRAGNVRVLVPLDEEVEMLSIAIEANVGVEGEFWEVSIGGLWETRVEDLMSR